jgi:transposase
MKTPGEMRRHRNACITERVDELIKTLPIGTDIYTDRFARVVGKVRGFPVERTHLRVFLRERDDLKYDRDHYVKVK